MNNQRHSYRHQAGMQYTASTFYFLLSIFTLAIHAWYAHRRDEKRPVRTQHAASLRSSMFTSAIHALAHTTGMKSAAASIVNSLSSTVYVHIAGEKAMLRITQNMLSSISPFSYACHRSLIIMLLVCLTLLASTACQSGSVSDATPLALATEDLNMLSQQTIFFGHQSVGGNIIQGMEDILPRHPDVQLTISHVADATPVQTPAFLHTEVGQNYDPLSKIQAFDHLMRDGMGNQADVAFFKFCYVDFNENTDVDALFATYKQTMADLARDYPETTIVHLTVPLMAQRTGFKAFVKNMIGRDNPSLANLQRHQFNELLRQEYKDKAPIFDLAQIESRADSNSPCTMTVNGQKVPCLYTPYTDDGEHLNESGRKVAAEQLLMFLARLP